MAEIADVRLWSDTVMDEELDRFKRDISLPKLATRYGYRVPSGQREGARGASVVMRNDQTADKIVVSRDRDGHWIYFSVRDASDNGTVIDFCLRRARRSLGEVRKELRSWSGAGQAPHLGRLALAEEGRAHRDLAAVAAEYERARLVDGSSYFRKRGIRDETLSSPRFHGTVRLDGRGNILFGHLHPEDPDRFGGFEKKNLGFTGFATGGMKTVWASRGLPGDDKLIFVEGAIDALSHYQLHPQMRGRYFSTGGGVGTAQLRYIGDLVSRSPVGLTIVFATDNDAAGEKLAAQIGALATGRAVRRHPSPIGKDWNDCLRARERDFIRSLGIERDTCRGRER